MSTHTPGPWTIDPRPDDIFGIRGNGDHYYVARTSTGGLIAKHKRSKEVAKANAHLIAAAPELLEALKHLSAGLHDEFDSNPRIKAKEVRAARAAIAKAEGTS